jgi:UDP-2,3-diacylglucosamine hydrolase
MSKTLFVSDLHLSDSTPVIETGFYHLLDGHEDLDRLFILGDFFEYWIGDDDDTPLHRRIIDRLASVSSCGTEVFIVRGNRDFMLGADFAEAAGATLLEDTTVIDVAGVPTLILHGDTLCTDDTEYQNLRKVMHDPEWKADILTQSLEDRRAFAESLRAASREKAENDPTNIVDVNPAAVENAMAEASVRRMIHGHTHRPDRHKSTAGERIVLGDWTSQQGWYLKETNDNLSLESFDLA